MIVLIILSILFIIYVVSVIYAYKAIRSWCIRSSIEPDMTEVVLVLMPIVNVVATVIYFDTDIPKKFFRINE